MSLNGIYATRMMLLPKSEAPHLLTVQRKTKTFSEGTWARIKSGKYKGDLAQVQCHLVSLYVFFPSCCLLKAY